MIFLYHRLWSVDLSVCLVEIRVCIQLLFANLFDDMPIRILGKVEGGEK